MGHHGMRNFLAWKPARRANSSAAMSTRSLHSPTTHRRSLNTEPAPRSVHSGESSRRVSVPSSSLITNDGRYLFFAERLIQTLPRKCNGKVSRLGTAGPHFHAHHPSASASSYWLWPSVPETADIHYRDVHSRLNGVDGVLASGQLQANRTPPGNIFRKSNVTDRKQFSRWRRLSPVLPAQFYSFPGNSPQPCSHRDTPWS